MCTQLTVEMLSTVKKARGELVLRETRKKPRESSASQSVASLSEAKKKQLDYFLKVHKRRDANLKSSMIFSLNLMKKREEIYKLNEDEFLKTLQDREEEHKQRKLTTIKKTREEVEKAKKKEESLKEAKKMQAVKIEQEAQERMKENMSKLQREEEHKKSVEANRAETVSTITSGRLAGKTRYWRSSQRIRRNANVGCLIK